MDYVNTFILKNLNIFYALSVPLNNLYIFQLFGMIY